MSSFDRPIGSQADVHELEYISFLHQTAAAASVRTDCSINADDIQGFLMSRYGIKIERKVVEDTIMEGLGGGGSGATANGSNSGNNEPAVIDLMELAALLLVPVFLKAAKRQIHGDVPMEFDTSTARSRPVGVKEQVPSTSPTQQQQQLKQQVMKWITEMAIWIKIFLCFLVKDVCVGLRCFVTQCCFCIPCGRDKDNNSNHNNYNDPFFQRVQNGYDADVKRREQEKQNTRHCLEREEKEQKRLEDITDHHLFTFVSDMIKHDIDIITRVTNSSTGIDSTPENSIDQYELTPTLVKQILELYGEIELSQNTTLLEQMIECCQPRGGRGATNLNIDHNGQPILMFDGTTLAQGATYDVQKYNLTTSITNNNNNTNISHYNNNKNTIVDTNDRHLTTTVFDDLFPPDKTLRDTGILSPQTFIKSPRPSAQDADTTYFPTSSPTGPGIGYIIGGSGGGGPSQQQQQQQEQVQQGHTTTTTSNEFPFLRFFTAPAIDVAAGTSRSKSLIVLLWASAILHFCSYYFTRTGKIFNSEYCVNSGHIYNTTIEALQQPWVANSSVIACETSISVLEWLVIFLYIGCYGLAFTSIGSIGNTMNCTVWWHPLIGCIPIVLSCGIYVYSNDNTIVYILVLSCIGIMLSTFVLYLHITHVIAILVSEHHLERLKEQHEEQQSEQACFCDCRYYYQWLSDETIVWLREKCRPRIVQAEIYNRQAMLHKLTKMTENAIYIFRNLKRRRSVNHTTSSSNAGAAAAATNISSNNLLVATTSGSGGDVLATYYGRALHAYNEWGVRTIVNNCANLSWTFQRIVTSQRLLCEEGIWFSVRVLASNIGQVAACCFVFWAGVYLMQYTILNFGNSEEIKSMVHQLVNDQIVRYGHSQHQIAANASSLFGTHLLELEQSGVVELNCTEYRSKYTDTYKFCTIDGETGIETCENTTSTADSLCALSSGEQNLSVQEQIHLMERSGLDPTSMNLLSEAAVYAAIDETIDTMYPSQMYMVTVPVGVGIGIASLTALTLTTTYLQSIVSTILQLRCGYIPLMREKQIRHQKKYREAQETVALLTGSIFWGCLASSMFNGFFIGFIVFLCLWQVTVFIMQRIVAIIVGIIAIFIVKFILIQFILRGHLYRTGGGYYRSRPAVANISILALEWANFTLSAGIIVARAVKLFLATGFSVGRVNRPLLANDANQLFRLGIELDGYPTIHLRELLSHEAHKHPYIELLGYMYLMKLRYNDEFGKTPGTIWRLLTIHALMPWLRDYRILQDCNNSSNGNGGSSSRNQFRNHHHTLLTQASIRSIRNLPINTTTDHDASSSNNNNNNRGVSHTNNNNNSNLLKKNPEEILLDSNSNRPLKPITPMFVVVPDIENAESMEEIPNIPSAATDESIEAIPNIPSAEDEIMKVRYTQPSK